MLCSFGCGREAIKQFKSGSYCCSKSQMQCPKIKAKVLITQRKTNLKRYGVESYYQTQEFLDKRKETNLERYGVENYRQSKEAKDYVPEEITTTKLCEYGCNELAKFKFLSGTLCCNNTPSKCFGVQLKIQNSRGKKVVYLENKKLRELQNELAQKLFQKEYQFLNKAEKTIVTSRLWYGVDHSAQTEKVIAKRAKTNIKRFGVRSYSQTEEFKERYKTSCILSLGVDNPFKSEEVKEKIQQVVIERYGDLYPRTQEFLKSRAITNMQRYGTTSPCENLEIKEKRRLRCRKRWGTDYPMQNATIAAKSFSHQYKRKLFTFPSGKQVLVQGYEPFAIQELLKLGYLEEDLIVDATSMPELWWENSTGKHRYFPDIFIPKEQLLIEVKSAWTLDCNGLYLNGRDILKNKAISAIRRGFNFQLMLIKVNGLDSNIVKLYANAYQEETFVTTLKALKF